MLTEVITEEQASGRGHQAANEGIDGEVAREVGLRGAVVGSRNNWHVDSSLLGSGVWDRYVYLHANIQSLDGSESELRRHDVVSRIDTWCMTVAHRA